jgi:alpha-glucosidase
MAAWWYIRAVDFSSGGLVMKVFRMRVVAVVGALLLAVSGACSARALAQSGAAAKGGEIWWKHAVIYEIYPRSFQDSNGDGTGDLNGITERLGYLHDLGVDTIWIAPMFPSPQVDFGYDISDYEAVDPQYGTMADMDRLIAEAKKHGIRVMLDMVLNHTSDKHAWFEESKSSKTNPKRDWYVWKDGVGPNKMDPPNNWQSVFGHSAWKYDPTTKQFYYHKFYAEQPDLNWRNPDVEKAIFSMLRFWLDKGIAGFRLDAIPTLFEAEDMKDETVSLDKDGKTQTNAYGDIVINETQTSGRPEVQDVLRRMRKLADSYPGNRVLVGETYVATIADLDALYGGDKHDVLHMPMDFKVGMLNHLDASGFRKNVTEAETMLGTNHPLFVFDNHDNPRMDRYCKAEAMDTGKDATPEECVAIQKMLSTLLFTSKATALMYYGDEIGMSTTPPARKEDVKDPIGILGWPKEKGRDGDRTPMQWTPGKNAGFSTADTTWLPIPPSYKEVNVEVEKGKPDSLLTWYTELTALRLKNPAVHSGAMTMLDIANTKVLSYTRKGADGKSVVVALNFTGEPQEVKLGFGKVSTLMTDAPALKNASAGTMTLPPYAAWVGEAR